MNCLLKIIFARIATLSVALTISPLLAQIDKNLENEIRFCLAEIIENHVKVRSGVIRIEGTYHYEKDDIRFGGPFKHFEAFDLDKNLRVVLNSVPSGPKKNKQGNLLDETKFSNGFMLMRDEYIIHGFDTENFGETPQRLDIYPRDKKVGFKTFEWQYLGLQLFNSTLKPMSTESLDNQYVWDASRIRNGYFHFESLTSVELLEKTDRVLVVEYKFDDRSQIRWHLDRQKSSLPFRSERSEAKYFADEKRFDTVTAEAVEITWKKTGDLFLPSTVAVNRFPDSSLTGKEHFKLNLEWEGVNQPLNSSYLNVEEFGLDRGAFLIDDREGEEIYLGPLGTPLGRIPTVDPPPEMQLWIWIAGGSLLFGLAMILIVVWRRKTR